MQALGNGDWFVGWGQEPFFSELSPSGQQLFDAHFPPHTQSYRSFRMPWTGTPAHPPALAFAPGGSGAGTVYASWNGATQVALLAPAGGRLAERAARDPDGSPQRLRDGDDGARPGRSGRTWRRRRSTPPGTATVELRPGRRGGAALMALRGLGADARPQRFKADYYHDRGIDAARLWRDAAERDRSRSSAARREGAARCPVPGGVEQRGMRRPRSGEAGDERPSRPFRGRARRRARAEARRGPAARSGRGGIRTPETGFPA